MVSICPWREQPAAARDLNVYGLFSRRGDVVISCMHRRIGPTVALSQASRCFSSQIKINSCEMPAHSRAGLEAGGGAGATCRIGDEGAVTAKTVHIWFSAVAKKCLLQYLTVFAYTPICSRFLTCILSTGNCFFSIATAQLSSQHNMLFAITAQCHNFHCYRG